MLLPVIQGYAPLAWVKTLVCEAYLKENYLYFQPNHCHEEW